ncbi:MAG TPA: DUF3794 domain-containing protein [Firmicutes bacterium]|nr:DUF3794 domain-containing protein [Bacillota bacterium]
MSDIVVSDFRRRRVKVQYVVADVRSSAVVTATLTVPQNKPDIASVLSAEESPVITKVTMIPGTVIIEGTVSFNILYVAALPTQPVHFFEASVPFTEFVNISGALPGMVAEVTVTAQFGSYRVVGPRTVEASVLLEFHVIVIREEIVEVALEVPREIVPVPTVTKRKIALEEALLRGQGQAIVEGDIIIPPEKPPARTIVHVDAASRVTSAEAIVNKVIVRGVVSATVLYVGALPDQPVHAVEGDIPFTGFIVIDGVDPGMIAVVTSRVEHVSVDIIEPRRLRIRAIVALSATVVIRREIEFIARLEPVPEKILVPREFLAQEIVAERQESSVFKTTVTIPAGNPSISRVIEATARPRITKVLVKDDLVIIEGDLKVTVLYVAALPGQPVYAAESVVRFFTSVLIPGIRFGMSAIADVDVVKVTAEAIDPRTVDVRIVFKTWVLVTEVRRVPAVVRAPVEVTVPEAPEAVVAPPVMRRIHIVRPGDTLWLIARQYGVTVEAIVQLNGIRDADRIEVGDALEIPS